MSRNKNRAYKKGKPFRDFRKFIIVAEGEREDEYFSYFKKISLRVDVEIVEREGGKSAAKYLWDRLMRYDYQYGIEKEDFVWFVLDVDRWPKKEIQELYDNCQREANLNVGISNPSFEVWLHYHILKTIPEELNTAKRLKSNLPKIIKGGYNRDYFASLIETAKENASVADTDKDDYFPKPSNTKLYSLAEKLLLFLGKNWK
ncbi:RloB family protein [Mucilaginibacter sp. NFR10]|uniref:RloB family protein n=1 Tax=Mucilaginibacter sp. NFR10 TaxID=1566292 RepID=UPI0008711A5F|nr:RloB family protein [Mucilaginibacter sp. NFR10]SCW86868.1 RloB-like protein [Mucilaginibacter sp. NFR10]